MSDSRAEFEAWVKTVNQAEIKWIGHSYANAYMAAQWEGWKAARDMKPESSAPSPANHERDAMYQLADKYLILNSAQIVAPAFSVPHESIYKLIDEVCLHKDAQHQQKEAQEREARIYARRSRAQFNHALRERVKRLEEALWRILDECGNSKKADGRWDCDAGSDIISINNYAEKALEEKHG